MTFFLLALVVIAVLALVASCLRRKQKRNAARKFGKHFEVQWVRQAAHDLQSLPLRLTPNLGVAGLGDVDLFVEHLHKSGEVRFRTVVEIKSFILWKSYFFGVFLGQRERDAVAQVRGLQSRLKADKAIIWLPQGRLSLWQRTFGGARKGAVHIVAGDTRKLAKVLTI